MKSFMLSVFPQAFPRSKNFPILSNNDERHKCLVTCCALLVILLAEKSMSSATYGDSPVNRGILLTDAIRKKNIFHTSLSSRSSFFQTMCMMYSVN